MQKILKMPLQYTEETHHCRKLDQRLDCEEKLHIAHKCWFKVEERYAQVLLDIRNEKRKMGISLFYIKSP